jgi:beta-galactosidase
MTAPGGWLADGSDIALIDFEVVDAQGRRCPTDQARVDFEVSGPGIWRGGYNSGTEDSTNHLYLDTECGINRVSIRSTLESGEVVLTARREGLESTTLRLTSKPVDLQGGVLNTFPVVLESSLPDRLEIDAVKLAELTELRYVVPPPLPGTDKSDEMFSMFAYTGTGAGGMEAPFRDEMLPYSDDARIYIKEVPEFLRDSRVVRTADSDSTYWAADYIVATAGKDLELYVAHDPKVPLPTWLKDFRKTGDKVSLNRGTLVLYQKRLSKDEGLRIPGNADQGKGVPRSRNIILFTKPVTAN